MDLDHINRLTERYKTMTMPINEVKTYTSSVNEEIKSIKEEITHMMEANGLTELETNLFKIKLIKKKHIMRLDQRMLVDVLEEVLGENGVDTIQAIIDKIEEKKRAKFTYDIKLNISPKLTL